MRKNILRTFITALLICAVLAPTAFADGATVTGSEVNLRSGPGMNYSILDCMPRGASITVTDRSNSDWYAVNYNGTDGFMSSRYVSITESGSSADVSAGEGSGKTCLPSILFQRPCASIEWAVGARALYRIAGPVVLFFNL